MALGKSLRGEQQATYRAFMPVLQAFSPQAMAAHTVQGARPGLQTNASGQENELTCLSAAASLVVRGSRGHRALDRRFYLSN